MILALDLGTTTGWACTTGPLARIHTGFLNLNMGRFEGGGMRFLRFENWLDQIDKEHAVKQVVYEEVRRHLGTDAAHVYGGLQGTLTKWCEANRVPYSAIPVGTIKKFATGKGNASKQDMIKAASDQHTFTNDNECDAYWVLKCHLSQSGMESVEDVDDDLDWPFV